MGHSHGASRRSSGAQFNDPLTPERTARALWGAVGVCLLVTLIGLVVLWPRGSTGERRPGAAEGRDTSRRGEGGVAAAMLL